MSTKKKKKRNKDLVVHTIHHVKLEMWANAQRDGRPAEYRWRALSQRRKVWLTPNTGVPCSNADKT